MSVHHLGSLTIGNVSVLYSMEDDPYYSPDEYMEGEALAETWRKIERGDFQYVGVRASVQIHGRELGEASLWGIEFDASDRRSLNQSEDYIRTVRRELSV